MKRLAVALATVGGAGFFPIAPGTVGSAVGVVIYWFSRDWSLVWQAALIVAITAAGTWASTIAAVHFETDDPSQVVVDEVAGQLVTLFACGAGVGGAIIGFLLFRIADIIKPWPANRFERFHGGTGIMADDLMAGVYANMVLQVIVRFVYRGL